MDETIRQLVVRRANGRCEYCQIPQSATPLISHHFEHIIARQHGGVTEPDNLALACDRCNAYKGPNLSTISPDSGETVPLFHPRKQNWTEHFHVISGEVVGRTETGKATVVLLNMNAHRRVQLRKLTD